MRENLQDELDCESASINALKTCLWHLDHGKPDCSLLDTVR